MGNAKAKRLYEAFLPECFQRPETDQSAEIFIRDKYDKKKYMDKVIDIQMLRVSLTYSMKKWVLISSAGSKKETLFHYLIPFINYSTLIKSPLFSLQKEKSCDNIPKEPVVFEKMKLVRPAFLFSATLSLSFV